MATNLTTTTFSSTYKDDYTDSDNYHRILFNSGKALQARELTQAQTIINKQIQRFGNNIYKEGAIVKPGGIVANNRYQFIKLDTTTLSLPGASIVDKIYTGGSSNVKVKILETVAADGPDPATLYVQYIDTSSSGNSTASSITVTPGETLSEDGGATNLQVQATNTDVNPASGTGTRVSFGQGIYYVKGAFVFTENQSLIASKYTDVYTGNIGYLVTEDIVTVADTNNLYDNQGTSPNLSAPGADRYRIRLSIIDEANVTGSQNFVHIATIRNGIVLDSVKMSDNFNAPNMLISKRIKENSGDYIVKPFRVNFAEDSASTHLRLQLSDGIVVVDGYRAARQPSEIRLEKPTTTATFDNETTAVDFGNHVLVSGLNGNTAGLPDIDSLEKMNIRTAVDHGGATIGTCRVRAVTEDTNSGQFRYSIFDIRMAAGAAFRDARSIGTSASNYFNLILENSLAVLKQTGKHTMLFKLPKVRPKAITSISLVTQQKFSSISTNGAGAGSFSTSIGTFTNTDDWIWANADSDVANPLSGHVPAISSGVGTSTINFTGGPLSSSNLECLAYTQEASAAIRSKTLSSTVTVIGTLDSDTLGFKWLDLGKPDLFAIDEIVNAYDSSQDLTGFFKVDNGQRDNYYGLSRLILKGRDSAGTISVKFRHFEHGDGNFFAINSYTGTVDYKDIPYYVTSQGVQISLRDYIDFRPVQDIDSDYSGGISEVNRLPKPGNLITSTNEYYLPKAAKLCIDTEANIRFIPGVTSLNPAYPDTPLNSLPIYNILMHPNTINDSDVSVQRLDRKRFTMEDINRLEQRVDKLEELTSLNMIELDTKNFEVLDSAGNNRTKSGFVIDNFSTHSLTEFSGQQRAALDPLEQNVRASFNEENIRLIYDSDATMIANGSVTKVVKKGDNLYLNFNEEVYINSELASKTHIINPFDVITYEGQCIISPESDEWRNVEKTPAKAIDGGTVLNTNNAYMWDNWSWNWGGVNIENLSIGSETNIKDESNSLKNIHRTNKVVGEEIITETVGSRVIQVQNIPFMRSKKVSFKATGIRPNSKMFVYFDGAQVGGTGSDWCRTETFARYSDNNVDYGDKYKNATSHPDGSSTLTSDTNGKLEGSFFIPSTSAVSFRTGVREIVILDISEYNLQNATSICRATYSATGYIDVTEDEIKTTRVLLIKGQRDASDKPQSHGGNSGSGDGGGSTSHIVTVNNNGTNKIITNSGGKIVTTSNSGGNYNPADDPYSEADRGGNFTYTNVNTSNSSSNNSVDDWMDDFDVWDIE